MMSDVGGIFGIFLIIVAMAAVMIYVSKAIMVTLGIGGVVVALIIFMIIMD